MTLAAVNKAALRSTHDVEKDDLSRMIHASSSLLCEQQQFPPRNIQLETLHEGAVHVAQDFFSVQECQAWIDMFNAKARMERVSHPASRSMAHRERRRWQLNDWGLSEQIFLRIQRPILSQGLDLDCYARIQSLATETFGSTSTTRGCDLEGILMNRMRLIKEPPA